MVRKDCYHFMEIKIAIVDDLMSDRAHLVQHVEGYKKQNNLEITYNTFSSGNEFLQTFEKGSYSLIFMDIIMNGPTGMDIAHEIRKIDGAVTIIFTTQTADFALEGYEVQAYAYLIKPLSYNAVEKVIRETLVAKQLQPPFIEVKENRCRIKLLVDDIIYVDVDNHYLQIHTHDRVVRTYMRFRDFYPMLEKYGQFLCCYRNILINMDKVMEMDDMDFVMETEERVPMKRNAKQEMRQAYADYIFQKMNKKD